MTNLFIILGVSIWLAAVLLAVALPLKPAVVKITEKLVCPPGTKMEVKTEVYSYHRPGQRAILIFYTDKNGIQHNINARAILALFVFFFTLSLPLAAAAVLLIVKSIRSM